MSSTANPDPAGVHRQQFISSELRAWILAQARAGVSPDAVLEAMRASGWNEEVALQALEQTLQAHLSAHTTAPAPAQSAAGGQAHAADRAGAMPDAPIAESPSTLWVLDRQVEVLFSLKLPRVIAFGGFLSDAECDQLVAQARPRMARSETVDNRTGGSEVNDARTSRGMFFERGETPLIDRIERRIAALVDWPLSHGEGLQILHYTPGAEYKPHYDYFDPAHPGSAPILRRGGQRVGTLVMYLNTPAKGGGTTFPDAGLEVAPIKGHAVFFSYERAHPDSRSLHGGAPVIEGEKWVATKWMREHEFT